MLPCGGGPRAPADIQERSDSRSDRATYFRPTSSRRRLAHTLQVMLPRPLNSLPQARLPEPERTVLLYHGRPEADRWVEGSFKCKDCCSAPTCFHPQMATGCGSELPQHRWRHAHNLRAISGLRQRSSVENSYPRPLKLEFNDTPVKLPSRVHPSFALGYRSPPASGNVHTEVHRRRNWSDDHSMRSRRTSYTVVCHG